MSLAMHTTVEVTAPEVLEVAKMAMVEAAEVVAAVEEGEQPIYNDTFFTLPRGVGSTGAAGAFAPVNFQQRVHCTRPDEELSFCGRLLVQKGAFWCKKCGTILDFWAMRSPTLEKFHAPVLSHPWRRP